MQDHDTHSELLIGDSLLLNKNLATLIGLSESIVLQQLQFLLNNSEQSHEGQKWIRKSIDSWHEEFSFWHKSSIRRILLSLTKQGLIVKDNFNKMKVDRTLWYRINHDTLEQLIQNSENITP